MEFCESHWDKMRAAVDARGLTPYVAQGGEEVIKRMTAEASGVETIDSFDPLMGMHWAIVSNLMEGPGFGVAILANEGCPLCFANDALTDHIATCKDPNCNAGKESTDFDWMIDRAADDQLEILSERIEKRN